MNNSLTLWSGEKVPAVWQGCSHVSNALLEDQLKVWKRAIELGSNAFDTAELYGRGRSEEMIGKLIKEVGRNNIFISTKVSAENLSKDNMLKACDNSLRRLGSDCIDLYHLHWSNPKVSLEDSFEGLCALLVQGKIRYVGISNFTETQISDFLLNFDGVLAAIQMEYNIINRKCEEEIIPLCDQNFILFQAYTPLNFGRISNPLLDQLSLEYAKTPFQIILNWMVNYSGVCVLPKTTSLKHVEENCTSIDFVISPDDLRSIDKEFSYKSYMMKCFDITPFSTGDDNLNTDVYKSKEEAIENMLAFVPSPQSLSEELKVVKQLSKPIRIRIDGNRKLLVGGNVRYWAWVLAFGMDSEIECIIVK